MRKHPLPSVGGLGWDDSIGICAARSAGHTETLPKERSKATQQPSHPIAPHPMEAMGCGLRSIAWAAPPTQACAPVDHIARLCQQHM